VLAHVPWNFDLELPAGCEYLAVRLNVYLSLLAFELDSTSEENDVMGWLLSQESLLLMMDDSRRNH